MTKVVHKAQIDPYYGYVKCGPYIPDRTRKTWHWTKVTCKNCLKAAPKRK